MRPTETEVAVLRAHIAVAGPARRTDLCYINRIMADVSRSRAAVEQASATLVERGFLRDLGDGGHTLVIGSIDLADLFGPVDDEPTP